MKQKNKFLTISVFFIILFLLTNCFTNDKIIVKLGNAKLTDSDIKLLIPSANNSQLNYETQKKHIINNWIEQELLYAEAKRSKLKNRKKINKQVETFKKQLIIEDYLQHSLYETIQISDNELLDYYNKNISKFIASDKSAIIKNYITADKKRAEKLKNSLILNKQDGIEFVDFEDDVQIQIIKKKNIASKISQQLFSDYDKEFIGPFQQANNFIIIQILKKLNTGEQIPYIYVKETIKKALLRDKQNSLYNNLLTKLKNKNEVEIYETNK